MPDARFVYISFISDAHIKIFIKPNKYKVKEHRGSKIPKSTAKVVYAWDKKILCFSKKSKFWKQEIHKNDHILIFMSTPKCWLLGWWYPRGRIVHQQWHRPSGVNSYQRYQDYNLVRQTRVSSTYWGKGILSNYSTCNFDL